jgi:hypothetical protein
MYDTLHCSPFTVDAPGHTRSVWSLPAAERRLQEKLRYARLEPLTSMTHDANPAKDRGVIFCDATEPRARLLAVVSLYGHTAVRLCSRAIKPEDFTTRTELGYSYGPGGSEFRGAKVYVNFASLADIDERIKTDKRLDLGRPTNLKRLPRFQFKRSSYAWGFFTRAGKSLVIFADQP